jgi:hypothetical protein
VHCAAILAIRVFLQPMITLTIKDFVKQMK